MWASNPRAKSRLCGALVFVSLLAAACGVAENGGAAEGPGTSGSTNEVACSISGGLRFSSSYLDGPNLSPDEFATTPIGATMEAFFVGGPGAPEGGQYLNAEGFSIVSESLVLGYNDQLPNSFYAIEDGRIAGWGGCRPNRVSDDLVASRWEPSGPVQPEAALLSIQVEGGACVTQAGTDVLTEVVDVDVEETADHVELTAWTRDKPFAGACAGIGVSLDTRVELASPLGDRSLLDGGTIPARSISFFTSENAPPTEPEDDNSALGRLYCSPGVVVEERVADAGQDPLEIARASAPGVVEVEPGEPLWWWGLNEDGAVIVGLARGDAPGADYQVWSCDPPLGAEAAPDQGDAEATDRAVRVFDVDGVEVVVMTDTVELPEQATAVEYSGTLIDSGSGPEMCFAGVNDSLPPQCAGVVVDGLDMSDWAEEAQGVQWGTRTVAVTWPPVDNHVAVLSDVPVEDIEFTYPPGELPEACQGIARFVPVGVIHDYTRVLGDKYGGLYLANSGELVLQVTDDPEPHRQALATGDAEACVIQISWTETELQAIAHDLQARLVDLIPYGAATGSGSVGRVDVVVPVADLDTVRKIAALVDRPATLRVIGQAIILGS